MYCAIASSSSDTGVSWSVISQTGAAGDGIFELHDRQIIRKDAAMRLDSDVNPNGRPSVLSFCTGGILVVLVLLFVASCAGYLW